MRLLVRTRRWVCSNATCSRRIFTERLPGVVAPYARRTARLAVVVEAIALALGGEGGARILATLGVVLSPDTLLNTIRAASRPAVPSPRVVGIDEWSWRRGRRFGTLLVDLERHTVIDLLPDRAVDSVVRWLERQPQVTIIARDRGGVYAEAATKGAPQATQVADRWHLLHNLAEVLEESCYTIGRPCATRRCKAMSPNRPRRPPTRRVQPREPRPVMPAPRGRSRRGAPGWASSERRKRAANGTRASSSSTRRSAACTPPGLTWRTSRGAWASVGARCIATGTSRSHRTHRARGARGAC